VTDLVAGSPRVRISRTVAVRLGSMIVGFAVVAGLGKFTSFETPLPVIVLGTIIGLTYGLLAVGLVLVYRSNRIINFAHGETGAFAAAVFGLVTTKWHVNYYVFLPLALLVGAGAGALAEVGVVLWASASSSSSSGCS
jgi:hypothetical protein